MSFTNLPYGTYTNIITTANAVTTYYNPIQSISVLQQGPYTPTVYGQPIAENAVLPDSPEAWLRRRIKDVCDLARN